MGVFRVFVVLYFGVLFYALEPGSRSVPYFNFYRVSNAGLDFVRVSVQTLA